MFKKISNIVSWIVFFALLIGCIYSIVAVVQAKETGEEVFIGGYRPVYVMTGSMEPYMREKSLVITEKVESMEEIEVGDVITYHLELDGKVLRVTHRIINIDNEGNIFTKGDNNNVTDAYSITIDNVEAKVVCVFNFVASIINKWNSGTAGKVICIVPIIFFILTLTLLDTLLSGKKEQVNVVVNVTNSVPEIPEKKEDEETNEDNSDENVDNTDNE